MWLDSNPKCGNRSRKGETLNRRKGHVVVHQGNIAVPLHVPTCSRQKKTKGRRWTEFHGDAKVDSLGGLE